MTMANVTVIYALPEKYATSIRLSGLFPQGMKKISQPWWPSFFPLKIIMILRQAIVSFVKIRRNEIIYASAPLAASAIPAIIVKKLKGSILVADWDDAFTDFRLNAPSLLSPHYWELECLEMADKVVVVSKKLEEIAVSMKGRDNVIYIPNGVDTEKFKSRKNASNGRLVIGITGYVGKIGKKFAYQEMTEIAQEIKDAQFLVVGYGKGVRDFKTHVRTHGLESRFRFVDYVKHEDIPKYIDMMDVCLVPFGKFFTSETRSSVKMKEFMSMGKAIVATKIGENITDLDNGKCGMLAEDSHEFAVKIKSLQKNPALRRELGRKARERAEKVYDFRILRKKLYKFLDGVNGQVSR